MITLTKAPNGSFRDNDRSITPSGKKPRLEQPFESMGQTWKHTQTDNTPCYHDQYGFTIIVKNPGRYELYHQGVYIVPTYTLNAAKAISLVLLNDKLVKAD